VWSDYLEGCCASEWLREVKTHHVQLWLEGIAREHEIAKTTLKHVKNLLSGIFRYAATAGIFRRSKPCEACRDSGVSTERHRNQTEPAQDEESLGWLNVTGSVWRSTVGDRKPQCRSFHNSRRG
jgi:hypothetical protein